MFNPIQSQTWLDKPMLMALRSLLEDVPVLVSGMSPRDYASMRHIEECVADAEAMMAAEFQ